MVLIVKLNNYYNYALLQITAATGATLRCFNQRSLSIIVCFFHERCCFDTCCCLSGFLLSLRRGHLAAN